MNGKGDRHRSLSRHYVANYGAINWGVDKSKNSDKVGDMTAEEKEFCGDILTTAVEGGSNYWAHFDVGSDSVDVFEEDDDDYVKHSVSHEDIHKAILAIVSGSGQMHQSYRAQIAADWSTKECGMETDAGHADIILQIAVLGEVVYG
jgi:hypothetical protein